MKKFCLLFLLLASAFSFSLSAKNIFIQLEGKKYQHLFVHYSSIKNDVLKGGWITCQSTDDGHNWNFTIPDSLHDNIESMDLRYEKNKMISSTIYPDCFDIGMFYVNGKDTLACNTFNEDVDTLKLSYSHSSVYDNSVMREKGKKLHLQYLYQDLFKTVPVKHSYMEDYMLYNPSFCSFYGDTNKTDQQYLKEYFDIIKKRPDSKFLIYKLYALQFNGRRLQYIEQLYNCFDQQVRNSFWGKLIEKRLQLPLFKNIILERGDLKGREPIIKDWNKYNLLIISASWCSACRRVIPLLKEIYKEKSDKLNLIYLSTDKPKDYTKWAAVEKKYAIPWRSLFLTDKNRKFQQDYFITGSVPSFYLVAPNKEIKHISLSIDNKEEKEILYKLLK